MQSTQSKQSTTEQFKNFIEQVDVDYYKPVRVLNFYSSSYIEYESNGYRYKTLLIKEYPD